MEIVHAFKRKRGYLRGNFDRKGTVSTYEFVCSNIYAECDEKIEGDSQEDVLEQVSVHMREHHGVIELPSDMTRWVLASVRPDDS